jgi:GR25 family glycosyltransferase involved in LPS biosynthesis
MSSHIITNLYRSILQRVPSEKEFESCNTLNPDQIKNVLLESDEFRSLNTDKLKDKSIDVNLPYTIISVNDRAIQNKNYIKSIMGTPPIDDIKFIDAHNVDIYSYFNDLNIRLNWDFPKYNRNVLPGELGCMASHLECLRYIVKNNIPEMIVFEDDAVLSDGFKHNFNNSYKDLPKDYDFFTDTTNIYPYTEPYAIISDTCLIDSNYIHKAKLLVAVTTFMLYSYNGAKKILEAYDSFGIRGPYDLFLFDLGRENILNIYAAFYGNKLTRDIQIAESLIDPNFTRT